MKILYFFSMVFTLGNIKLVIVWDCHWYSRSLLMFTIGFHQKNRPISAPQKIEIFFKKFSPSFFIVKKMDDVIFFNLESSSRLITDIFCFVWEVFLIDFLSKMKSQMAWKGLKRILSDQILVFFSPYWAFYFRVHICIVYVKV